ncbi:hypothetical protein HGRIS_010414 [Hohenbuehelia grisea]|uniref:Secreted protein n=1 Tax=Hohenbuehelia grisea TaxID=104357 RepID=A0ABR3J4B1_9AGAR
MVAGHPTRLWPCSHWYYLATVTLLALGLLDPLRAFNARTHSIAPSPSLSELKARNVEILRDHNNHNSCGRLLQVLGV